MIPNLELYILYACRGGKDIFGHASSQIISFPCIFSYEVTKGCVPSKQEIYLRREEKGISKMFAKEDPRMTAIQVQVGVGQRPWDRNI